MGYSPRFRDEAYDWLLNRREGAVPPPLPWRVAAWSFLAIGGAFYLAALWLVFTGEPIWALGAAVLGFLLRRQVRVVAPQLVERLAADLNGEGRASEENVPE